MSTFTWLILFLVVIAWFLGPWPVIQMAFTLIRLTVRIVAAFIRWPVD